MTKNNEGSHIFTFFLLFLVLFLAFYTFNENTLLKDKIKTQENKIETLKETQCHITKNITGEDKNQCLKEIQYHIPENMSGEIDIKIEFDSEDLCYDFINDPDDISDFVDEVFEKHPDDWWLHMNWEDENDYDPIVNIIINSSIKEIKRIDIFGDREQ